MKMLINDTVRMEQEVKKADERVQEMHTKVTVNACLTWGGYCQICNVLSLFIYSREVVDSPHHISGLFKQKASVIFRYLDDLTWTLFFGGVNNISGVSVLLY